MRVSNLGSGSATRQKILNSTRVEHESIKGMESWIRRHRSSCPYKIKLLATNASNPSETRRGGSATGRRVRQLRSGSLLIIKSKGNPKRDAATPNGWLPLNSAIESFEWNSIQRPGSSLIGFQRKAQT